MTDPIQQQLITARKNQILDAATAVFVEKGFHPATIRDIAKHAGISDGTIYNYFDNKTALLLGIFDRMKASVMQENHPLAAGEVDFRTFIRTFLSHPLTAQQRDNFALFRIVFSEMMVNEELRTLYYKQILEPTLTLAEKYFQAQAAQQGLEYVYVSLTIRAISSLVLGLMMERIMDDAVLADHWEELPDFLTDLILNGIGNTSTR